MQQNAMSIVIPAHDNYKEIVELYVRALRKNWADCPFEVIWSNGEESLDDGNVKVINCGLNASFCQRVLRALEEADTEYILLTIEDLIISDKVDNNDIELILKVMQEKKYNFCKIGRSMLYKRVPSDPDYPFVKIADPDLPYGLSINCGIFKFDFLKEIIKNDEWSPWELENYCLLLTKEKKLKGCIYDSRDILHIEHLISKGKIIPTGEKNLKKNGIDINLSSKWQRQTLKERLRCAFIGKMSVLVPKNMRESAKKVASKIGIKTTSKY